MRKTFTAWLLTGVIAIGALGIGGAWTSRLMTHSNRLSLELEAERQRNFHELVGHMQAIQGLLGKGTVAGTVPQNMLYMSEVYRRTSLANANFMALPLPGPISTSMGKFLNQTGDFAYSIARNEAAGRAMDAKQRAELGRLQQVAEKLANDLQVVGQQAANKGFRWVKPAPTAADLLQWRPRMAAVRAAGARQGAAVPAPAGPNGGKAGPNGGKAGANDGKAGQQRGPIGQHQAAKNLLPGGLEAIGPQMDRMPQLIYDGPFSDHLKNRAAAMTGAPITEEEARRRAVTFLPDGKGYTVVETAKREGTPKTFAVRLAPAGAAPAGAAAGYTVTVDVTQEGGYLASFINSRQTGPAKLNLQAARDIGKKYLDQHGFANMVPTYGEAVDGWAAVQFALREHGTMIYPDQIKVRVALDTGEVIGVDARQYIMGHRDRGQLEVPAVTQAAAAKVVNPDLKVEHVQLALIPNEAGDNEVLTYEFRGRLGHDTYLVYVNAKSGAEERIIQVLTTKNGTLAL